jgi:hypothetical protein
MQEGGGGGLAAAAGMRAPLLRRRHVHPQQAAAPRTFTLLPQRAIALQAANPSRHSPTLSQPLAQSAPEPRDDDEPFVLRPEHKGVAAGCKLRCESAQTRVNIVL